MPVKPELVVPIAASTGAVLVALLAFLGVALTGRTARRAQAESWRRQDAVAERAELAAKTVSDEAAALRTINAEAAVAAAAAAAKLQQTNEAQVREVRRAAAATHKQLGDIQATGLETKKFVDGAYTAQLQVELTVQRAFAAQIRQNIMLLHQQCDTPPEVPELLALLAVTDARIAELVPLIAERTAYMNALADAALAAINALPKEEPS